MAVHRVAIYHRRVECKRKNVINRFFFGSSIPFAIRRRPVHMCRPAHVNLLNICWPLAGRLRAPCPCAAHIAARRSYTRHLIILTVSFGILLVTFIVQYLRFINAVVHQTETLLTSFCSASRSHGTLLRLAPSISHSLTLSPTDAAL